MTVAYNYRSALLGLTALCRLAFQDRTFPDSMSGEFVSLIRALEHSLVTPARQTDLLEIAGGICRAAACAGGFEPGDGAGAEESLSLLEEELEALFSRTGLPSLLPKQLTFVTSASPRAREALGALYGAHLTAVKARLYLDGQDDHLTVVPTYGPPLRSAR